MLPAVTASTRFAASLSFNTFSRRFLRCATINSSMNITKICLPFPTSLCAHRRSLASDCSFPGPSDSPTPGIYRHYITGDLYQVLGTVMHTETSECMVLYRSIHPSEKARLRNPLGMAFVRPSNMFKESVEHQGKKVKRFAWVEQASQPNSP